MDPHPCLVSWMFLWVCTEVLKSNKANVNFDPKLCLSYRAVPRENGLPVTRGDFERCLHVCFDKNCNEHNQIMFMCYNYRHP
jgi:hypothetical protein